MPPTLNETPQPTEGKIPLTPPTASTSDGHSKEPSIYYYDTTSQKICQANAPIFCDENQPVLKVSLLSPSLYARIGICQLAFKESKER
jgi:hypothetical protein